MKKVVFLVGILFSQLWSYSFFTQVEEIDRYHFEVVHAIKDVVITTQKTRGLTNNYMNGNVVAQLLVYAQREEMMKDFKVINKRLIKVELPSEYKLEAQRLMKRLKTLNKGALRQDSGAVFAAYTAIIESWLALNSKIIDSYFAARPKAMFMSMRVLNNMLLPLTENIGKLRGMGSGIVARTYCKEKEIPKMNQFANEIDRYRSKVHEYMIKNPYAAISLSELNAINEQIVEYTNLTRTKVIAKEGIALNTNAFFDEGTACIGEVIKIYNVISADLGK